MRDIHFSVPLLGLSSINLAFTSGIEPLAFQVITLNALPTELSKHKSFIYGSKNTYIKFKLFNKFVFQAHIIAMSNLDNASLFLRNHSGLLGIENSESQLKEFLKFNVVSSAREISKFLNISVLDTNKLIERMILNNVIEYIPSKSFKNKEDYLIKLKV